MSEVLQLRSRGCAVCRAEGEALLLPWSDRRWVISLWVLPYHFPYRVCRTCLIFITRLEPPPPESSLYHELSKWHSSLLCTLSNLEGVALVGGPVMQVFRDELWEMAWVQLRSLESVGPRLRALTHECGADVRANAIRSALTDYHTLLLDKGRVKVREIDKMP